MYTAIQTAHSIFAYIVLALLFFASLNAITGLTGKRLFKDKDLRLSLFALIVSHLQLLLGIILYFVTDHFKQWSVLGMKLMSNDGLRKLMVEHPITNVLAIVLITIGWSKHKKEESNNGKFKKIAVFYTIGLILLLSMIPWSQWMS
ncbi:MAG: hypothetical protein IE891_06415 [Flavobacteriaceae bacterium]|nr:hypothetical protein [Flavobacteriaceae bacterium]